MPSEFEILGFEQKKPGLSLDMVFSIFIENGFEFLKTLRYNAVRN